MCACNAHALRCLLASHVFKTANKCRNGSDSSSSSIIECLFDRERKRWYTGFYGLLITTLINFIDFWLETIFFYFPFFFRRYVVCCHLFFCPCEIAHTFRDIIIPIILSASRWRIFRSTFSCYSLTRSANDGGCVTTCAFNKHYPFRLCNNRRRESRRVPGIACSRGSGRD